MQIKVLAVLLLLANVSLGYASSGVLHEEGSAPIPSSAKYSYQLHNLHDRAANTAWCTQEHRDGLAWFGLSADENRTWTGIGIINGYGKDRHSYLQNSRAKEVAIYLDGVFLKAFQLKDTGDIQWLPFKPQMARKLKVTVKQVYRGERDDDLCISEVVDDEGTASLLRTLERIAAEAGDHSLKPEEIRKYYQPLIEKAGANRPDDEARFMSAVALQVNGKSKVELRVILNLLYQVDTSASPNAEVLEGLMALLDRYLEYSPEVVLAVLNDKSQLKRDRIALAYENFINVRAWDDDAAEKYMREHPAFMQISKLANEFRRK